MSEISVSSWRELNEALYEDSWNPGLRRFRSNLCFRGVTKESYDLKTTLMRLGGGYDRLEGSLLRNFRKYAHRDAVVGDSVWSWLTVGQHHGLPTRLLDWTFSPYVAMHFATDNREHADSDGAIWGVDYVRAREFLPPRLRAILNEEYSVVFSVEMLNKAVQRLSEFDALANEPFVVFFEPPSLDDRVVNQYALLSAMSNPCAQLDQWLAQHPELYRKLVIPSALKWEVRDKLDQANITERMLFPGLDGLSRWLKRHYGPGP